MLHNGSEITKEEVLEFAATSYDEGSRLEEDGRYLDAVSVVAIGYRRIVEFILARGAEGLTLKYQVKEIHLTEEGKEFDVVMSRLEVLAQRLSTKVTVNGVELSANVGMHLTIGREYGPDLEEPIIIRKGGRSVETTEGPTAGYQ